MTISDFDSQIKAGDWVRVTDDLPNNYNPDGTRGIKAGSYLRVYRVSVDFRWFAYKCNHPDKSGWAGMYKENMEKVES